MLAADNPLRFRDQRPHIVHARRPQDAPDPLRAPGSICSERPHPARVHPRGALRAWVGLHHIKSRSGANAIATWMVLQTHGFAGGVAFCRDLMDRTERLWLRLNELGVGCYRHGRMNVVALDAPAALADRWLLAPDAHHSEARWRKTVMLEHVNWERLEEFLEELAGRVKS